MAKKEGQKVKGCKKCGRTKKRKERFGNAISAYVRGKITAKEYFALTSQTYKGQ